MIRHKVALSIGVIIGATLIVYGIYSSDIASPRDSDSNSKMTTEAVRGDIKLRLTISKEVYKENELIPIELTLSNTGDKIRLFSGQEGILQIEVSKLVPKFEFGESGEAFIIRDVQPIIRKSYTDPTTQSSNKLTLESNESTILKLTLSTRCPFLAECTDILYEPDMDAEYEVVGYIYGNVTPWEKQYEGSNETLSYDDRVFLVTEPLRFKVIPS